MPRHAREYYDTSFFHVIVQGIDREYIFKNERYITEYLKLMEQYKEETNAKILAYCIMNNHAHMLIYTPIIKDMSNFMKKVNGGYAKFYNRIEEGRVGYVFRDRFLSEPIKDEGYLIKCINYIHNNPVKAGIVEEPKKYKHSSYNEFVNGSKIKEMYEITGIKLDKEMITGKNYRSIFIDINEEKNVKDILKEITEESIEDIKKNKEKLKEIIFLLKNEYKINYKEMMKQMDITPKQMRLLRRATF